MIHEKFLSPMAIGRDDGIFLNFQFYPPVFIVN